MREREREQKGYQMQNRRQAREAAICVAREPRCSIVSLSLSRSARQRGDRGARGEERSGGKRRRSENRSLVFACRSIGCKEEEKIEQKASLALYKYYTLLRIR